MVSPVFFGLRSVFLFAARHAGRGDAVRLAQTTPLATVSRQVPLVSPLWGWAGPVPPFFHSAA